MKTLRCLLLLMLAALIGSYPGFSQVLKSSENIQQDNQYKCEDDQIEVMFLESSQVRMRNGQPIDLYSDAMNMTSI